MFLHQCTFCIDRCLNSCQGTDPTFFIDTFMVIKLRIYVFLSVLWQMCDICWRWTVTRIVLIWGGCVFCLKSTLMFPADKEWLAIFPVHWCCWCCCCCCCCHHHHHPLCHTDLLQQVDGVPAADHLGGEGGGGGRAPVLLNLLQELGHRHALRHGAGSSTREGPD